MVYFIVFLLVFLLIWLIVICCKDIKKDIKAPQQLHGSFNELGDLKGKTYDEIVSFLGKPDLKVKNSDETFGASWNKTGIGGSTEIMCIFNNSSVCIDFEETSTYV